MPRHKMPLEPDRRSDYGSYKTQDRDWDGWEFVGSMKWVRADILGECLDPLHRKALVLSKEEQQQQAEKRSKVGRGGKRTGLPWQKIGLPPAQVLSYNVDTSCVLIDSQGITQFFHGSNM